MWCWNWWSLYKSNVNNTLRWAIRVSYKGQRSIAIIILKLSFCMLIPYKWSHITLLYFLMSTSFARVKQTSDIPNSLWLYVVKEFWFLQLIFLVNTKNDTGMSCFHQWNCKENNILFDYVYAFVYDIDWQHFY